MDFDFRSRITWVLGLVLVLSATFALGQGIVTGSISGIVQDPQRAVVSGAQVTAKNIATGQTAKSTTNESGYFSMRNLPVGNYAVTVESSGFRKLQVPTVVVQTGSNTDLGIVGLEVGTTTETVTVEGGGVPLVETTSAQGGSTFTSAETQNLPLNGGFDQLALLIPGVVTAGGSGFSNNNGAQFAANGQRDRSNNFQIDGQYNNDNSVAGPAIFLSNQDALQEVQVVSNNFGVEYGRNSGTVVNYVTKSGTNNFHGSGFEYYTGNFADSLTQQEKSPALGVCGPGLTTGCSLPSVARYTENRWGGTFGGPIIPSKMFFFGSYTQDNQKVAGQVYTSGGNKIPTPTGISQLETCYPGNAAVAVLRAIGPFAVPLGSPVATGLTPTDVGGSNGLAPCPGVEFGVVRRALPGIFNDYEVTGKVDFNLTQKDTFFVRYLFQQQIGTGPLGGGAGGGSSEAGGSVSNVPDRGQQIALDWSRTWTTHFVNQIRFSVVRTALLFQQGSFPSCTTSSVASCPPTITFPNGGLVSFGYGNNLPQGRKVFNTQFQDNASLQKGHHTFKFGGEYDRQRSPSAFLPNFEGTYQFADFNSFLANNARLLSLTHGNLNNTYKEQDAALYFGDDWRVRDNLTLNLGVRWEYTQQAINLLAKQSLAQQTGPNPFWNTSLPLNVTTVPFIPNVYHNFAPRVGFAWTPHMLGRVFGENKTVIRGGFSMAYDPAFYNMFLNVQTAAPVVNAGNIANCVGCLASNAADVQALNLPLIPTGGNPGTRSNTRVTNDFHNPYAEQWTLGIQREITRRAALEVRYVGTHTIGEFQTINGNPALNGLIANGFSSLIPAGFTPCADPTAPGASGGRINCEFRNLRVRANSSFGIYHGLQTQFKMMAWHGFTSVVAYTYSKNIDNASEIFSNIGADAVAGAQNPFDIARGERALSALDFPHVLSVYWNYELPFMKGQSGGLGKVFGGWVLAGTYKYTSGQLWSPVEGTGVNSSCQNSFDGTFFSGISTCRPFAGNFGAPVDTVGQCTNPTAADCGLVDFYSQAPTTVSAVHWIYNDDNSAAFFGTPYGNTSRNPHVRGDTINTVNLNLIKNTKVSERVTLRLEANLLNAFNHPFYGVPDPLIDDGNFANIATFGGGSFGNTFFNNSGGGNPPFGTGANAAAVGSGLAQRRLVVGAHISF